MNTLDYSRSIDACSINNVPNIHRTASLECIIESMLNRILIVILLFIVTACGRRTSPPTPNPNTVIGQAIAATLSAVPPPTSRPLSTPFPSPTAFDLNGLFCEYQFCIGHPVDMALYDVSAVTSNQGTPSTYQTGLMAAYSSSLVIQVMWQFAPGSADPTFLLNLIIEDGLDTPVGTQEVKLVRDMNVIYTRINTNVSPVLPFGAAAAWTCGDRVFAWKVYTPDEASAATLFENALARFTCNR
jgi:hypothetical protein